ncbi:MAG: hypothetical protein ABMB14_21315, partial [Myxococcota bacterium]
MALLGADAVLASLRGAAALPARVRGEHVPDRHRAIDRVVEDSWSHLDPSSRDVLAVVAQFDGPVAFSVLAATGVPDLAETLAELVDRSLVVMDHAPTGPTWRTLVTVRALVRRARPVDPDRVFGPVSDVLARMAAEHVAREQLPSVSRSVLRHGLSVAVVRQWLGWVRTRREGPALRAALLAVAVVAAERGAVDLAVPLAIELLASDPEPGIAAHLHYLVGWACRSQADVPGAIAAFGRSFDDAVASGRYALAGQVQYEIGNLWARTDRPAEAGAAAELMWRTTAERPGPVADCGEAGALSIECRLAENEGRLSDYDALAARSAEAYARAGAGVEAARMLGW